jgi:hypothetical protein
VSGCRRGGDGGAGQHRGHGGQAAGDREAVALAVVGGDARQTHGQHGGGEVVDLELAHGGVLGAHRQREQGGDGVSGAGARAGAGEREADEHDVAGHVGHEHASEAEDADGIDHAVISAPWRLR